MYRKGDGFQTYGGDASEMLVAQWASVEGVLVAGANRDGSGYAFRNGGSNSTNVINIGDEVDVAIPGFAFEFYAGMPTASAAQSFSLQDGSGDEQLTFCFEPDGSIDMRLGDRTGAIIASTDPDVYDASGYWFLEIKAQADASDGTVELRINNVTRMTYSGGPTVFTGNVEYSRCRWRVESASNSGKDFRICDFRVLDGDTGELNDFLGDCVVYEDVPDEDGADADWTPSSGGDMYAMVDDIPEDGDTTYDESSTVSDRMGLNFPDLPSDVATVYNIEFFHISRKTTAGAGSIQVSCLSNGSEEAGGDDALTETYNGWSSSFAADPDTSSPWLKAAAEAATMILERTA